MEQQETQPVPQLVTQRDWMGPQQDRKEQMEQQQDQSVHHHLDCSDHLDYWEPMVKLVTQDLILDWQDPKVLLVQMDLMDR